MTVISFGQVLGTILDHVKYSLGFMPFFFFFPLHHLPHLFIKFYYRGAHLSFPAAYNNKPLSKMQWCTPSSAIRSNIFIFFFYWSKVTDALVYIGLYFLSILNVGG